MKGFVDEHLRINPAYAYASIATIKVMTRLSQSVGGIQERINIARIQERDKTSLLLL